MMNYSNITENVSSKRDFNIGRNVSCTEAVFIINCAINAPLMIISILGNSLVLAAISRTPSLRSPSIMLLCSLAVSDFLVGVLVQPLYIASCFIRTNYLLDSVWFMLSFVTCGISLCSITAISVDRFLALHYHMRYPAIVTSSRVKIALGIMWLTTVLFSGVYFWSLRIFFLLIALGVCLYLKVSIYSYIRIYRIVRHHEIKIHCQQQAVNQLQIANVSNMLQLKKSALNSFVFFIVMVVFYLPMNIGLTLFLLTKSWQNAWSFTTTLVFANSSVNPFLYCWRLSDLRAAVVKTLRKMFRKQ